MKLDPDNDEKTVIIGEELAPEEEEALVNFLKENKSVFAWSAQDLHGVSRQVIEHNLNMKPRVKPKKQKVRKMSDEKVEAIKVEVKRLLEARVIREVQYPQWLTNTVPVKKKYGK